MKPRKLKAAAACTNHGSGSARVVLLCVVGLLASFASLQAQTPVVLVPDGAWTWFNDPRAVFKDGLLYFGYVRDADGRSVLSVHNPTTGNVTTLWNSTWTETDDHDNAAILKLQDGRLMGFYSRHAGSATSFEHRITTGADASIPGNWSAERTYTSPERVTYANPFQLSAESGRIYNFMRNLNYNPTVVTTTDFGGNWTNATILIKTGSGGSIRPYVKYASNGADRIDFLYTDGHPRDVTNSLYHAYYSGGNISRTDGSVIKAMASAPLLHDSGERGSVIYQYNATATTDPNDFISTGRAWCWDIQYGAGGHPACVFTVQVDKSSWSEDRIYYYYARWVPGTGWQKRFIAHAGRPLYSAEDDYAGGICIDPANPNVVYISTNAASPFALGNITQVPLAPNNRYEIYRGVTADGGLTFTWQAMTANSATDNLRPCVPADRTDYTYALIWMSGTYSSYTSWNTSVRGYFSNTPVNEPPVVTIARPVGAAALLPGAPVNLRITANVTDDGPPSNLTLQWSVVSGPAPVVFGNSALADTTAAFTQPGQYVLRATGNDTLTSIGANVTVEIGPQNPSDPALWLPLDESAGSTAVDLSGQGNNGTLTGNGIWQPAGGTLGGAIDLDGSTASILVPDSPDIEAGSAFTVAWWFRADSYNPLGAGLVTKRDGLTANNTFTAFLQGNSTDTSYRRINVDINGNNDRFISTTNILLGTWYHVAVVYNGTLSSSLRARLYIDGLPEVTANESSASVPDYPSPLRIGVTHSGVGTFFDGRIDDVRFFQRALSAAEIGSLAGRTNFGPVVSAGVPPSAINGIPANLNGTATDDGLGGNLTVLWTRIGGPGTVAFGTPTSTSTTLTANGSGNYILRLSATDSKIETFSDLAVEVAPNLNVYDDWISDAFPGEADPGIVGPKADPEADGSPNLLEFGLGLNPTEPDARPWAPGQPGLPVVAVQDFSGTTYLTLTVRRPVGRSGITYGARVSGNLTGWAPAVQVEPASSNGDGTEDVLYRDTVPAQDSNGRFIELIITRP